MGNMYKPWSEEQKCWNILEISYSVLQARMVNAINLLDFS